MKMKQSEKVSSVIITILCKY